LVNRRTKSTEARLRPHASAREGFVTEKDRAPQRQLSVDDVETLVWLLRNDALDNRRYRVVNRLRSVRDSDEFASLPEDLRMRVREIVAESER
jgi:hypothetical protein